MEQKKLFSCEEPKSVMNLPGSTRPDHDAFFTANYSNVLKYTNLKFLHDIAYDLKIVVSNFNIDIFVSSEVIVLFLRRRIFKI